MFSSQRARRIMWGCFVALSFFLSVLPLVGQETAPVTLTQTVKPNSVNVDQATTLTLELQGGSLAQCATDNAPADIVLVVDVSDSMNDEGRLSAAKLAAEQFINNLNTTTDQAAIVAFSTSAYLRQSLTQDKQLLQQAVRQLETIQGTDIGAGLQEAFDVLRGSDRYGTADSYIILLSDGDDNNPAYVLSQAENIQAQGIQVYTISLGNTANQTLMTAIAFAPDTHYHAPQTTDLVNIYMTIGGQIAETVATNIVITTTLNSNNIMLDESSLSPNGTIDNSQIVWTLPSLQENEVAGFSVDLQPIQSGSFPAAENVEISYLACGVQPDSLTPVPGPALTVSLPIPTVAPTPIPPRPCELDPLSNECVSTVICAGPMTLPCTLSGLPWWVCLLLLLLLLLALLFWWLWKQKRSRTADDMPPPLAEVHPPVPAPVSPLGIIVEPDLLKTASAAKLAPPLATLIVGLGEMGKGVVDEFMNVLHESYGNLPATTRLLNIDIHAQDSVGHEKQGLTLPLNQTVFDLARDVQNRPGEHPHLASWLTLPAEGQKWDTGEGYGRSLHRLTLFLYIKEVRERIRKEIHSLNLGSGQRLEVFVISSISDAVGSGLLIDATHITRLEAESLNLQTAVYNIALLPQTNLANGQANHSFAHWRELNRFQLAFAHEYPIPYAANNRDWTKRKGQLFERTYLIEPDRDGGPSLAGPPLKETLYPAIADFLMALLDPAIRHKWEEVYRSVDSRLHGAQAQQQQVLYNSMGCTTYVLPVDALAHSAQLDLLDEIIKAQLAEPDINPSNIVARYLDEPGDDDLPTTRLIQSLSKLATLSTDDASSEMDKWDIKLGNLLAPTDGDLASWQALEPLVHGNLVKGIPTGYEAGTKNEAEYHELFVRLIRLAQFGYVFETLDNVDEIVRIMQERGLDGRNWRDADYNQITTWLDGAVTTQKEIFARRLAGKLQTLLDYDAEESVAAGVGTARTFLTELIASLTRIRDGVQTVLEERKRQLNELNDQIKAHEQRMDVVKDRSHRNLGLWLALAIGLGVPALIVIALGSATLFMTLPTLLLLVPVAFVLFGTYWTYLRLFIPSKLAQLEKEYRDLIVEQVKSSIETFLYKSFSTLTVEMQNITQKALNPLDKWAESLEAIQSSIEAQRKELHAQRQKRKKIQVRHYLEDEYVERSVRQKFISSDALQDALDRIQWEQMEDGAWEPRISGTKRHQMEPEDVAAIQGALVDLVTPYTLPIRQAAIEALLPDYGNPDLLARESDRDSSPFIRTESSRQPDMESHRFVCVQSLEQTAYFQEIVNILHQSAAMNYTQQLIDHASHPHRCYILSTFDLINIEGLPSWWALEEAYHGDSQGMLPIFPAETHAARWETLLPRINLPIEPFSPYDCLALENEVRAYAFGVAYAFGWIKERDGVTKHERSWILELPEQSPLALVTTKEGEPSLWQALVNYGLLDDDTVDHITTTVTRYMQADSNSRRQTLEQLEQKLDQIRNNKQDIAKMSRLLHLVAEDLIRRFENAHFQDDGNDALLNWITIL